MASFNPFTIIDDSSLTPEEKISRLLRQTYEQSVEVAQKATEVAQKATEVAQKDTEVARKDAEVANARKDAEVANARKDAEVAQKDTEVARKDTEVARKDAEVADARRQVLANRLLSTSTQLFKLRGKLHARGVLGKFALILRS